MIECLGGKEVDMDVEGVRTWVFDGENDMDADDGIAEVG